MVEGQGGEVLCRHPGQDGHRVLRELGLEPLREQPAEMLGVGRHLDHGAVAGREDAGERADREEERIVPGRDDADDPFRLRHEAVRTGREQQGDVTPLRAHPLAELATGVADAVDAREQLEHQRLLHRPMTEVRVDRLGDRVGVLDEDAVELAQVLPALGEARVGVPEIRLPLQLEDALRLVVGGLDPAELGGLGHGFLPWDVSSAGFSPLRVGRGKGLLTPWPPLAQSSIGGRDRPASEAHHVGIPTRRSLSERE